MTEDNYEYDIAANTTQHSLLGEHRNNSVEQDATLSDGSADWPAIVRYGVPALCLVIFVVLLTILYHFPSPQDETTNCIQRMFFKKSLHVSMFQISTICVHWVTLMPPLEQTFYFLASVMEHGNSRLQVDPELLNIGGYLILNVLPKCCLSCTSSYTAHWHCSIQINTIEMQASRKEMMQQRGPRTHQESVNEAFDDAAV